MKTNNLVQKNKTIASTLDPSRNYSYLGIVTFFGFLGFILRTTAYTWGEQDMMPFFERVFDSNYLAIHGYNVSVVLCFVGILLKEYGRHSVLYLSFFSFSPV